MIKASEVFLRCHASLDFNMNILGPNCGLKPHMCFWNFLQAICWVLAFAYHLRLRRLIVIRRRAPWLRNAQRMAIWHPSVRIAWPLVCWVKFGLLQCILCQILLYRSSPSHSDFQSFQHPILCMLTPFVDIETMPFHTLSQTESSKPLCMYCLCLYVSSKLHIDLHLKSWHVVWLVLFKPERRPQDVQKKTWYLRLSLFGVWVPSGVWLPPHLEGMGLRSLGPSDL